jgi:hypothetical protein
MTEYLRPKWNITLCMYSHSSYSDAWPCFFSQCDKFMSHYPKALFTDSCPIDVPEDWTVIEYDDSQSYSERVAGCLEKIKTKLCFFHHEDMFLYDKPDYDILDKYEQIVLDDTEVDFVRLLRGVDLPLHQYTKDFTGIDGAPSNWWDGKSLFHVPDTSPFLFAVQPSIFITKRLKEVYDSVGVCQIRDFETVVQDRCRDIELQGLFHYNYEPKLGMFHYGSNAYPYIATAIVAGKWNLSGYSELRDILSECNIDYNDRGYL